MAKLYVFGIGGTGSRVIKSLSFLLATGIEVSGFDVVPIIIDPDEANGDVTRTIEILKNYQRIRDMLSFSADSENGFFRTKIDHASQNFRLALSNIKDDRFKTYIEYGELDKSNMALASLLFSEANLESNMEVGFKGNPNIGSVVLNQFTQSVDFTNFASGFSQGDRIFIISSIFGGTGAAGFPLLLKNIRNPDHGSPAWRILQDAPVGAITMLPYFGVAPSDESTIEKATFISKTKAALSYYEENVSGNNSLNILYYLGDSLNKDYPNHEGATNQKNDAHFLEVVAALSIIDFAKAPSSLLENIEGKAQNPDYKEFGIRNNNASLIFADLGSGTQQLLKRPLTQYQLFSLYIKNRLSIASDQNWAQRLQLDKFVTQPFFQSYLQAFNRYYSEWLSEMAQNQRSFAPFNLTVTENHLFDMVKGVRPHSKLFERGGKNYARFDYILSSEDRNIRNDNPAQHFMALFYKATATLVSEKYKF